MLVPNNTKKSRLIEFSHKKCVYGNGSNFFVFENYGISFSGFLHLLLKRSFPGSFDFWDGLGWYIPKKILKIIQKNRKRKIGYTKTDGYSP